MDFYLLIFINTLFLITMTNVAYKQLKAKYMFEKYPDISIYRSEGRIINFKNREIKTQYSSQKYY